MSKLTGKCLTSFNDWLGNKKHPAWCMMFEGKGELTQNAYYIDFFDSVGIYIYPVPSLRVENRWNYRIFNPRELSMHQDIAYLYNTRQEATNKAIEKANELYNEK